MIKHRGFPGRLTGTDFQFTIRRANHKGITPLIRRERKADRRPADKRADAGFMAALWDYFGDQPFERGNLDAGRLSWLFGREVVPASHDFDDASYEALLKIDVRKASASFPDVFDMRAAKTGPQTNDADADYDAGFDDEAYDDFEEYEDEEWDPEDEDGDAPKGGKLSSPARRGKKF